MFNDVTKLSLVLTMLLSANLAIGSENGPEASQPEPVLPEGTALVGTQEPFMVYCKGEDGEGGDNTILGAVYVQFAMKNNSCDATGALDCDTSPYLVMQVFQMDQDGNRTIAAELDPTTCSISPNYIHIVRPYPSMGVIN